MRKNSMNATERANMMKENGMDNMMSINLSVPANKKVKIVIEDKEFDSIEEYMEFLKNGDETANNIKKGGYVRNVKIDRPWITAQTFRNLYFTSYRTGECLTWDECLREKYSYDYQFEQMRDELNRLAHKEKEHDVTLMEESTFFSFQLVDDMILTYLHDFRKYCMKWNADHHKTYHGKAYVRTKKFGNILIEDLNLYTGKIYSYHQRAKFATTSYREMYSIFCEFMKECYNPLPYNTRKIKSWKNAFKGAGAYYALMNLAKYHDVTFVDNRKYRCIDITDPEKEVKFLKELLSEYGSIGEGNEWWRFHEYLKMIIEKNHFNLKESIQRHNNQ